MATVRWFTCAAATLLSALAISSSSRAGDLGAPDLVTGGSLSPNPDDVRQTGPRPGDDASKVTDLESTRAAIDRHAGPALSLSVSGWIGEQVIRAH
jgi:hypothetical protein